MTQEDRVDLKLLIQGTLQDVVQDFLIEDREADAELPTGSIQRALGEGVISVRELVQIFEGALCDALADRGPISPERARSPEVRAEMLRRLGAGATVRGLSRETGIPRATLRRWATEAGVKLARSCTAGTAEQRALALRMRAQGVTQREIAQTIGVSRSCVSNWCSHG